MTYTRYRDDYMWFERRNSTNQSRATDRNDGVTWSRLQRQTLAVWVPNGRTRENTGAVPSGGKDDGVLHSCNMLEENSGSM